MGSSQSRPSTSQDPSASRTGFRRRLEPLRRFSTLGRRKRDRSTSTSLPTPRAEDDVSITALASTGSTTDPTITETTPIEQSTSPQNTQSAVSRTLPPSPAPSIHYPVRRPPSPINSPISVRRPSQSRSTNERVVALRRTLNIPEWNTSVNVSRRRSWGPESEGGPSGSAGVVTSTATDVPSTPTTVTAVPSSTDALLTSPGSINTTTTTSANTLTSTNPLPPRSPPTPPVLYRTRSEPATGNTLIPFSTPSPENQVARLRVEQGFLGEEVALLRQQLEVSRRELAQAVTDAADAESNLRELENQGGAVMMIQGIAQTHIPIVSRRVMGRWRRERERRVPFEEQASTIIGLILVASLATANTLLSSERPRPRPNTILETLMRRIHPTRAFAVETLLADPSISQSPRRNRRRSTGTQPTDSGMGDLEMPTEFTDWLNTLQGSIREAMREFVEGTTLPLSRTTSAQHTEIERPGAGRRISAPVIQRQTTLNDLVLGQDIGDRVPQDAEHPVRITPDSQQSSSHQTNSLQVPQFHVQPGQTPPTQNRTGVTTDANGTRRLNFFRAHIFAGPNDDPNTVVPCLFVGVRSTTQDPATFGENGGHPFSDLPQDMPSSPNGGPEVDPAQAQAPSPPIRTAANEATSPDGELLPAVYRSRPGRVPLAPLSTPNVRPRPTYDRSLLEQAPSSPNGGAERPSRVEMLRSRLLALSPFSSHQRPSDIPTEVDLGVRPEEPEPQATFIMYVIGGNFPRNHPVLRIPGLITGEPLSDEEMVLMGELMGEVKPPTATAEEVEKSGLKVVKGNEIGVLVGNKEVIDSSADRCLVCLSDFEGDEDCRILNCRHVFHMDCVDQWIKVGRNACPACRTEAVDRKTKADAPQTESNITTARAEELDVPRAV